MVNCKLQQQHYPQEKLAIIKSAFMKSVIGSGCDDDDSNESEIITQLKQKFHAAS